MNQEQPKPEQPGDADPVDAQQGEAQAREPQSKDPRRRLRELLAVPDRDRSEAIWDEIVRLEIELAPGNRAPSSQGDAGRRPEPNRRQEQGRRPEQARRDVGPSGGKPGKGFSRRPRRGPRTSGKT